jgi:hypothetical protein
MLEPRPGSEPLSIIVQFAVPPTADAVADAVISLAVTVAVGAVGSSHVSQPAITNGCAEADEAQAKVATISNPNLT